MRYEGVKSPWYWLYHLVCRWLWMLQPVTMHTLPRTNSSILQLTWVLIVVGVYIVCCSNIECPIIRELYKTPESNENVALSKIVGNIANWHGRNILVPGLSSSGKRLALRYNTCIWWVKASDLRSRCSVAAGLANQTVPDIMHNRRWSELCKPSMLPCIWHSSIPAQHPNTQLWYAITKNSNG